MEGFFYDLCLRCGGTGNIPGTPAEDPCAACGGDGEVVKSRLKNKVVFSYQISDALDATEYGALAAGNQAAVNIILSMGFVGLAEGTNSRVTLWALFDSESTTRANLITLLGE